MVVVLCTSDEEKSRQETEVSSKTHIQPINVKPIETVDHRKGENNIEFKVKGLVRLKCKTKLFALQSNHLAIARHCNLKTLSHRSFLF